MIPKLRQVTRPTAGRWLVAVACSEDNLVAECGWSRSVCFPDKWACSCKDYWDKGADSRTVKSPLCTVGASNGKLRGRLRFSFKQMQELLMFNRLLLPSWHFGTNRSVISRCTGFGEFVYSDQCQVRVCGFEFFFFPKRSGGGRHTHTYTHTK